jgi:hypothetical protein
MGLACALVVLDIISAGTPFGETLSSSVMNSHNHLPLKEELLRSWGADAD